MLIPVRGAAKPGFLLERLFSKGAYFLRTRYWHTGERCCEDFPDENFVNHFKVYRFASQFCKGKDVLDVGCGTGYGSSYLAASARSVAGIDISRTAVRYARRRYRDSQARFLCMNAESLRFPNRSFDFLISTENFEHLGDQRASLREASRVLRDDGMLLLATPNHEMFTAVENPYHTHELQFEELVDMVSGFFSEQVVAENLLPPPTNEGRRMREDRERRGAIGAHLIASPFLWGDPIDTSWLSNTHSLFCFARGPRRG